ncbi:hypothetical protein ORL55_24955 [Klebsiella oxytoca]|nr:hypothetical protein [Klebsiella oxytoca]MCW9445981.1 hypothetical protein [Klebsiella oxytoca]
MRAEAALTPIKQTDTSNSFLFIENNNDDNYFLANTVLDPRLTGANKWTGLKYSGSGGTAGTQQSLGYISTYVHYQVGASNKLDMWLENSPAAHPLTGWRCINWYNGCSMDTSRIEPAVTDSEGFYGAQNVGTGAKWLHGMLSDAFYQYLRQMPTGSSFTTTVNACYTSENYDARAGERCRDQATGTWRTSKVTHTKMGHLRIMNTNALQEVFINSDGEPTLGEGNADCRYITVGTTTATTRSGLSCKMVNYTLHTTGISSTSIRIYPVLNHAGLSSAINVYDMQFSLDGNSWVRGNNDAYNFTFNDMKSADSVYIFMSSNFFKKMVELGISDISTRDLFNIRFRNTVSVESGYYEFSTSNELIIKPRNFSVSIISDEYTTAPSREGNVGNDEPSLDFGYIVTVSGKTSADEVDIKVTGPTQQIQGRDYCIFSSQDNTIQAPFPGQLSFTTQTGSRKTYDAGCNGNWYDMADALWSMTPWTDSATGTVGISNKTFVQFSILMNETISQRTVDNLGWFGDVSASGEIHVRATWRNVD